MKSLLVLSAIFSINCTFAKIIAPDLIVYTTEIPGVIDKEGMGLYNRYLKKVQKDTDIKMNIKFFPAKRALDYFHKDDDSCYFPYSKDNRISVPKNIDLSVSIGEIELHAVSLKSRPLISKGNIAGHNLFALRDIYKDSVDFSSLEKKFWFVKSEKQLFGMLDKKRVDYILESVPDVYLHFPGKEIEFSQRYQFDPKFVAVLLTDHIACKKNSKLGKKLIDGIGRL
jgi:hypothetical protein